jgi:hypothetical protein
MKRLTRRTLLRTGGGAGAAIALGLRPWSPAVAGAAVTDPHLRRASYAPLVGTTFSVTEGSRTVSLKLLSVSDVARHLAGRDDAFALSFSASGELGSGIHTLRHPQLGRFALFLSPVERASGHRYEILVDRSVGVPKDPPSPVSAPAAVAPGVAAATAGEPASHHAPILRRATLRRVAHGIRCEVLLRRDRRALLVRAKLVRHGHTVAKGMQTVQHGRARLRMHGAHRVKPGAYVLVVSATYADGTVLTQRKHVRVR